MDDNETKSEPFAPSESDYQPSERSDSIDSESIV